MRFSIGFDRPHVATVVPWTAPGVCDLGDPLGRLCQAARRARGTVAAEHLSQAYNRQPVWRRVLVLLAGPGANFLFAVCAYWLLFVVGVPALKPVIGEVTADSIAARAGLAAGDEIVTVGGRDTPTRETAVLAILDSLMQQRSIEIGLRRANGAAVDAAAEDPGSGTRALTEPGALLPGLGFDFWYPTVPAIVGTVLPDSSAAERAGLEPGDRIVAIGGEAVADFPALVQRVQPNPGRTLEFTVERPDGRAVLADRGASQREGDRMVGRDRDQPAIRRGPD